MSFESPQRRQYAAISSVCNDLGVKFRRGRADLINTFKIITNFQATCWPGNTDIKWSDGISEGDKQVAYRFARQLEQIGRRSLDQLYFRNLIRIFTYGGFSLDVYPDPRLFINVLYWFCVYLWVNLCCISNVF